MNNEIEKVRLLSDTILKLDAYQKLDRGANEQPTQRNKVFDISQRLIEIMKSDADSYITVEEDDD